VGLSSLDQNLGGATAPVAPPLHSIATTLQPPTI